MNTPDQAIHAMLETIYNTVVVGQYQRASNTANTLLRLAYQLDSDADMFIGDVLNTTCNHFEHVKNTYVVPATTGEKIHGHLVGLIGTLVEKHKEGEDVMYILQEIRCAALSLVLTAEQKYAPRQSDQGE